MAYTLLCFDDNLEIRADQDFPTFDEAAAVIRKEFPRAVPEGWKLVGSNRICLVFADEICRLRYEIEGCGSPFPASNKGIVGQIIDCRIIGGGDDGVTCVSLDPPAH